KGVLSFTDEAELEKLRQQNDELERSIQLEEKKKANAAAQAVNKIKKKEKTLFNDFDDAAIIYKDYKEDYEGTDKELKKSVEFGEIPIENYEATMESMEGVLLSHEKSLLDKIEKFKQYKEDFINKYGNDDISEYSESDKQLYEKIVQRLQEAYKSIYSESEYNKIVIEPIFDKENFKGLQDQLLRYFVNGGSTKLKDLENRFGSDIIGALKNACESAGIDFDKMIEDIYNNSQQKLNQIAPIIDKPNGAFDAKQNSTSKNIRDFIQNELSEEDRTILLNAEIPEDKKFETTQDVINFINSLNEKANENSDKTPLLSFKEAWENLKSVGEDAEDLAKELLELAQAGKLTPEVLESNEQYAELLKSVGDNAAIAANKINKMVEASDQLSSMKSGIGSMSDVLAEKKDNLSHKKTKEVGIGADTLAGFDAEIKGLDSWEEFEETLGNGKSSMEECQEAANKLATEWVNSNNFLAQLNGTNEDYYKSTLKEMGVKNADEVVTKALAQKEAELNAEKEWTKATTLDLADATVEEINQLASEKKWSNQAKNALYALALEKQTVNGNVLDFSSDIDSIIAFAEKLGYASSALRAFNNVKTGKNGAAGMPSYVADNGGYAEAAQKEYDKMLAKLKKPVKIDVNSNPTKSGSGSKSSSSKDKAKATKQTFDWLERKVTTINTKLDLLKAKLENVFSVKKKNSIIDKEIKNTNTLISTYNKQAKIYKQQANNSAKSKKTENGEKKTKLSSSLKKKVQNGQIKGTRKQLIKTYGESTANAIEEYQKYWDKYQQALTNIQTARTSRRELKIQKNQNYVDYYDALNGKYDAQMNNATTAKAKNTLEDKKLASTKKYYDYQIKIAKLEQDSVKEATLRAEKEAALRDIRIEKLQNLSDEKTAQYELNQQLEANANTAKEKNQYESKSRSALEAEYSYQIKIAKENGDVVEQQRLRAELEEKIEESYKKQIENIREEYNLILGLNDARRSTIDSQISALQANGYGIGTDLYKLQIELDKESYKKSIEEIRRIEAELPNLTGDALQQAKIDLESEKQAAWAYQQSMAEAQQAINDINLAKFERLKTMLEYISDELDYIQKVLSHSDFTFSDKGIGGLTIEGLSNMAVSFAQMSNNVEQIANIYSQVNELQRQLDSGDYVGNGDDITAKIHDLIQEAHDLESANYDLGESIKDLVIDSLNSLADALDESISKYKDALQAQKDLYDYRRKVADQLKSIASLEKQLAALQGSDTEEARARIQRLQVELADEQQNLKDMEYDKYIQDQEDMLDKVSDDFQDFIAAVADMSVADICQGMSNAIQDNLSDITTSIQESLDKSTTLGSIATGITGLSDVLSNLDYAGKENTTVDKNGNSHYQYTDNNGNVHEIILDSNGTIIGAKINGKDVDIKSKDVLDTESDINNTKNPSITLGNASSNNQSSSQSSDQKFIEQKVDELAEKHTITQGNGKLEVGDKVKIAKNAWYTNESGTVTPKQTQSNHSDAVVKKIKSNGYTLVQHSAFKTSNGFDNNLAWVETKKISGFSKGGIASELNKVALANGDDGWATLKRGESVLTPEQTEQFRQLVSNLKPLNNVVDSMKLKMNTPVPTKSDFNNQTQIDNIDIHLDGSNVVDPDSFIKTLHNPRVLKEVSNGVSSQIGTKMSNRLSKF
ncbi:MAG: hypothetical protein J1E62_05465, partial [Lachnospiraceae bacterium]|nr:hypothetical protein [Lachnospiraceae bacterium]